MHRRTIYKESLKFRKLATVTTQKISFWIMHPISYKGSVFSRNQHTQKNNLFMGEIIFENKPLQSLLTREIRDLFFEFRWVVRHSCFCKAIDDVTTACHRYTNLLVLDKDINGIFLFSAVLVTTSWTCCFFSSVCVIWISNLQFKSSLRCSKLKILHRNRLR